MPVRRIPLIGALFLDLLGLAHAVCARNRQLLAQRKIKLGWMASLLVVLLSFLLAGCVDTPITEVDSSLVGEWRGDCEIGLPVVFDPTQIPEGVERSHTNVALVITIHDDASIEGRMGEATFVEAVLKQNRTELGRVLNVETDYIIADGYLSGPIVPGADETERKSFTVPFNLVEGRVQGSLFWLQSLKYPYPLCRVDLER